MFDSHVMGSEGTYFGVGVVESRQDPLFLGRVQVRVFETHTSSLTDIPSADLPWAVVLQPTTLSEPLALKENDRVFIIWLDGPDKQLPLVVGRFDGFNAVPPFSGSGFTDLRDAAALKNAPRKPTSITYPSDGSGIKINDPSTASVYPTPKQLNLQTLSGATRYDYANTVIQYRISNLDKNILTANGITWSEPYPAYNPLYPYNHAVESESGHLSEMDDTPGCERVSLYHRSGSFFEYYPTGSKVEKVTRSNYEVVMGDDFIHVMGRALVTVGESCYVKVQGDANLEVGGNFNLTTGGDITMSAGGDVQIAGGTVDVQARVDASINGTVELNLVGGAVYVTGLNDLELGVESGVVTAGPQFLSNVTTTLASLLPAVTTPTLTNNSNSGKAPAEATGQIPFAGATYTPNPYVAYALKNSQFLVDSPASTITSGPLAGKAAPDATVPPNDSCPFSPATGTDPPNGHTFIPPAQFSLSAAGAIFIQNHESSGRASDFTAAQRPGDPPGLITVGYGTTNAVLPTSEQLVAGKSYTKTECVQFFNDSINNVFLPALQSCVTVSMTQNMIDACLSMMYNIGAANFAGSSVCKYINQQRWCSAYNAFGAWNKSNGSVNQGLVNRRNDEKALFIK